MAGISGEIDQYGFERPADFNYESYEAFMSEYIRVLARRAARWDKLMKKQELNHSRKVKRFVRKGVPSENRGEVWLMVSNAQQKLESNPGKYKELLAGPKDESTVDIIQRDIQRTYPENMHFKNVQNSQLNSLRNVLIALAQYKMTVGYCQVHDAFVKARFGCVAATGNFRIASIYPGGGHFIVDKACEISIKTKGFPREPHENNKISSKGVQDFQIGLNYVAGMLLLITKNEEHSFWLLVEIIERLVPDFYSSELIGVRVECRVLMELLSLRHPDLYTHFKLHGIDLNLTTSKWFICLFMDVLPVETALRIWDCLFYEGSKILLRVALTLIVQNKDKFMASQDFNAICTVFKEITKDSNALDCHQFMQDCFKLPGSFPMAKIIELRTKCQKAIEEEDKSIRR